MDAYETDGKAECSYNLEGTYHGEDGQLTEEDFLHLQENFISMELISKLDGK